MVQRMKYRRRISYNTKSNQRKISKTPGGRLVYLYRKKRGTIPKCGDCKKKLRGITPARPRALASLSKPHKTVTRVYGGSRCHRCVRDRIIRAFLIDEKITITKMTSKEREKQDKERKEDKPDKKQAGGKKQPTTKGGATQQKQGGKRGAAPRPTRVK